jgi:hypothetical protein
MTETWQQAALKLGKMLQEATKKHPELAPLRSSWANFARKHHLQLKADDTDAIRILLERHGLTILPKQDVDRYQATITSQTEEIKVLEHRITTLLRP